MTGQSLYPTIEPHDTGLVDVGDGHVVYREVCGNPEGTPAIVLHGGPGSGCTPFHRRLFDPGRYRIVLFDQRACGRSRPHASDPAVDLGATTTDHLIGDIETLRDQLDVDRWLVFGASWGSTLGLAYAERHPDRVHAIVLAAVTTTSRSEIDWLYHGVRRFLPEQWERFRAGALVNDARDAAGVIAGYRRLLESDDAAVREEAAKAWCAWEDAVAAAGTGDGPNPRYDDPVFRMAFARLVTHTFANGAWLDDGQILRDAGRLGGIPGVLIHGELDLGSPLVTAWELAAAWPDADLVTLPTAGHSTSGDAMVSAIVAATDRFAGRT